MSFQTVLVVSDIHYASEGERARRHQKDQHIANPLVRLGVGLFGRHVWLRNPTEQNHLLTQFFNRAPVTNIVVANGDFSCDSLLVGLSDDASMESARLCLDQLRHRFSHRLHLTIGDHELGKLSQAGGLGGPRLESWRRATAELGFKPFWQIEAGRHLLMGVTSTLGAWPVYHSEALPDEAAKWQALREAHLADIRTAFAQLSPDQRVILFCHDPTALAFLYREPTIQCRLHQIESTIIGHLHSPLFLDVARMLSGLPHLTFLGTGIRRTTAALRHARLWKLFRAALCPALAGTQLENGGFLTLVLSDNPGEPIQIQSHEIRR